MTNTTTTPAMSTTKNNRKGAVKGTVAAAAGIAVLLGGMGTFALWNVGLGVAEGSSATGTLTADFVGDVAWTDITPNAGNPIDDIEAFRMVPGDRIEGKVDVEVTYQGENLLVDGSLDTAAANLPPGVTATVELDGQDTVQLQGAADNSATTDTISAVVTLDFDQNAQGSMAQPIDLTQVKVNLQQVLH